MVFNYLTEENIFDRLRDSEKYMRTFFEPLDEYERIARNKPHPGIKKNYPRVTDGTASSVVQKSPRRAVQQLPTGRVMSGNDDYVNIIASFIYQKIIILKCNTQFPLIQKCWNQIKRALTIGSCVSYAPLEARADYIGPGLVTVSSRDVLYAPGKVSLKDSPYVFLRAWYQPEDIEAIIHQEKQLAKNAKERGEKYESEWDVEALELIKSEITVKSDEQSTKAEKERDDDSFKGGVMIYHGFQRGVESTFLSIHVGTQKIVRRKKNKDPRGEIPLDSMYADTDGTNPLGWGVIEQLAPVQNLIDSEMQMYQFNRALMLAPPIITRGSNWNTNQVKLKPNIVIKLGNDKIAAVVRLKIDSRAITNFPQLYGLLKSQLLNLAASPDSSISAEVGNPGFSKTHAGVKQQQFNVSVDDNHVRKQFEAWFESWSETAINMYFAERSGTEEIQLDQATADRLRSLENFDHGLLTDKNVLTMDFDAAIEKLKFEVDASSSQVKNDQQQLDALDGLLGRLEKSPVLQSVVPTERVIGVWNRIVATSGVEDPEQLSIDLDDFQKQQEEADAVAEEQAMADAEQAAMAAAQNPRTGVQLEPPEAADSGSDNAAFVAQLRNMGYPDDKIGQALVLEADGYGNEDIIAMLASPQGAIA